MSDEAEAEAKVHQIHRQLCGKTIPEFVADYVKENPIPTEEEMRKTIEQWFVWPEEYCYEYTDNQGVVHREIKPEYHPKKNPEAAEQSMNKQKRLNVYQSFR